MVKQLQLVLRSSKLVDAVRLKHASAKALVTSPPQSIQKAAE